MNSERIPRVGLPNDGPESLLTTEESALAAHVGRGLREGLEILEWWRHAEAENRLHRTPLVRQAYLSDYNYGFVSEVPLQRGILPVIGVVQDMFYDRNKQIESREEGATRWLRAQVQAFMMRYFMRVSYSYNPWSSEQDEVCAVEGWGYSQLYYKLKKSGEIGKFSSEERYKIVDLREIGEKYEWIVLKVQIFDFNFIQSFMGPDGPRLEVPVAQDVYVAINRDFVMNQDAPTPGVQGEYGYGYAIVGPPSSNGGIVAYGPRSLFAGFEFIHFRVLDNAEVRVKMVFVADAPTRLINFEPIEWGFQLMNTMSLGLTSRVLGPVRNILEQLPSMEIAPLFTALNLANSLTGNLPESHLCMCKSRIVNNIMALHFWALYHFILQTLPTWESVPNWLDESSFPKWLRAGSSSCSE